VRAVIVQEIVRAAILQENCESCHYSGGGIHTSTERLKRVYASPGPLLEIYYTFHRSYAFNYYLQLLCLQVLSKTHIKF
jgi:hypothetical protein